MRATLRERVRRVRVNLGLAAQAGVAAGIAWFVAYNLLGHVQPFFAPIAAVVTLAISVGQRMRRASEIVLGNACGILLGETVILVIGRGAWQIGLVVLLAIVLALLVGGSGSLVTQAANSGALVATLIPLSGDYFFSRFIDAVVGGGVALVVMGLLLPLNPLTVVERAANPVLAATADGLADSADAIAARDRDSGQLALDELRRAEAKLRAFSDSIAAGKEIALAPIRWGKRAALGQYVDAYDHVARALRNTRVLVRRGITLVNDGEPAPESLVSAIRGLADATDWLRRELADAQEPEASRSAAIMAVRDSEDAYLAGIGFSGSVIIAQIRSIATDLLRASGLEAEETDRRIRRAIHRPHKP
jgi:uncharacterized membrane protein YgaE (UPF0421/DUF939 family)